MNSLQKLANQPSGTIAEEQAKKNVEKADKIYEKALSQSLGNVGSGSGKVGILLPTANITDHLSQSQKSI